MVGEAGRNLRVMRVFAGVLPSPTRQAGKMKMMSLRIILSMGTTPANTRNPRKILPPTTPFLLLSPPPPRRVQPSD